MGNDVERRGLGAPAARADVIEKLVRVLKSPKLTADWVNRIK